MTNTDKFSNGPWFEEALVQVLLEDHKFAEQMMEVLDIKYFTLNHLQTIAEKLRSYYDEYKSFPSVPMLQGILRSTDNVAVDEQVNKYFASIEGRKLNGDTQGIKDQSLEFCRKQKLLLAFERCLEMTETKKFDEIVKEITDAASKGAERDFGHVWEERLEERMQETRRKPVATPWSVVNTITAGGLSPGELGVLLALTGVGKSHALVDIGADAAMSGLNVVHLTYELSEIKTGKRYDARISDVPYDELAVNREYVEQCVNNLSGAIRIKHYPNRIATVQTVRNYLTRLTTEGFKPDLLIIDYADIMKSSKSYENKRFEEEAVYEELRSLADELNIPIWTAAQTNRAGMDVEVLTLKHIAECFSKAMIADLFITMNRRKNGNSETLGNFFIAKNRIGNDGMKYHALFDTSRSRIRVMEPGSAEEQDAFLIHDLQLELTPEQRVKRKLQKKRAEEERQEDELSNGESNIRTDSEEHSAEVQSV